LSAFGVQLFSFADTYRGKYSDSITIVDSFYESWSGYDVSNFFFFFSAAAAAAAE